MSEKILVPVKIEALVVDKATASDTAENWKSFPVDYEALAARQGTYLEPGEWKELQPGGFCEQGIHLHWALPAALTNGVQQQGKVTFPAVPNRWLIIRTHLINGEPVTRKWILESDFIGNEPAPGRSAWAVQLADGRYETTHTIGRSLVLEEWEVESAKSSTPLTAMAPGNASFAAVYQYCRNVFGFWDNLAGLDTTVTTFSYLITGWYSDASLEPLMSKDAGTVNRIRSQWPVTDWKETDPLPDSVLCHGYIHSVLWNPDQEYVLPARNAATHTGAGLTSVEAKTAQLSRQTGAAERLLSSYLYDGLKDLADATAIDTLVDSHTYTACDGGMIWDIRRKEKEGKKDQEEQALPPFPDAAVNPGLSAAFRLINTAQQATDRLQQDKHSLLLEFRALCDKMIMAEDDALLLAALTAKRDALKQDIDNITAAIAQQNSVVEAQKTLLLQMPALQGIGKQAPEFELLQQKMPRFWQSNDPAVLFSGPGVPATDKYKNPGNSDQLFCRTGSGIATGLQWNNGEEPADKTITAAAVPLALNATGSLQPNSALITLLYQEAVLFDPAWTLVWAQQYYKETSAGNVHIQDMAAYMSSLLQLSAMADDSRLKAVRQQNGAVIRPDSWNVETLTTWITAAGIQGWQHPWTPLYLIWYVQFTPSYRLHNGQWQFQESDWEWTDKQYRYLGSAPDGTQALEYSGKALLTDIISDLLQQRLPGNVDAGRDLSQALGSFSDALLMRRHSIQIPLLKTEGENNDILKPDETFDAYLTKDAYFFPDAQALWGEDKVPEFFPLRAGHLQFTRLWLTDTFGQVQKVVDSDDEGSITRQGQLHIAERLNQLDTHFQLTLSPRVIQPARLRFRWCAAQEAELTESTSDPVTSPVCGWLLPDFLNQSLAVYEADGSKCGFLSMRTIEGRVQLQWNSPPGVAGAATPEQAINNSYLLNMVNGLLNFRDGDNALAGGEAVQALFELCNNTALFLSTSAGEQAPGLSGLTGQPLALVRAALQLELQGLPAQPQHFGHTITEETKTQPPGLAHLSFPVALGDSRNTKDGLVGYFLDGNEKGFGEMHIPYGMAPQTSSYFTTSDMQLAFGETTATGVTLLMDPRGGVQAAASLLPVKFIDLPDVFTGQIWKQLEQDLLVAPFLGAPATPFLPLGAEPDRQWVLKQQTSPGNWTHTNMDNQTPLQTGALYNQVIQEGYLSLLPHK